MTFSEQDIIGQTATAKDVLDRHEAWVRQQAYDEGYAAARRASGWLPIDSAPKDGTVVRLYGCYPDATTPIEHLGWWSDEFQEWIEQSCGKGWILFDVTHWAPRGPIPQLTEHEAQQVRNETYWLLHPLPESKP